MAGPRGIRTLSACEPDWTTAASVCTFAGQMSFSALRTLHVLKPVMTGWQAYVAAERNVPATANDQQPRGY